MIHKNDKITYDLDIKEYNTPSGSSFFDVSFTVLKMDERFRNPPGVGCVSYKAKNGLSVESASFPELTEETIYLWGQDLANDHDEATKSFTTCTKAKAYTYKIKEALEEWAEKWEGFKVTKELPKRKAGKGLVEIPNRIKYSLERRGTGVIFCVYEMNEAFRNSKAAKVYTTKEMTVSSSGHVAIGAGYVFLRGSDKERDLKPSVLNFDTVKEAKEYIVNVNKAIAEWAANWEGFKETKAPKCKHCEELKKEIAKLARRAAF